ncbi:MAG: PAS domain-containing protein [Clostridiaceae bacterium]|nr:PAS domain-containing protein [Clostridiaceae bacterium]
MITNPLLERYIPMAEMLVQTFGEDCEVVLHDLSNPQHSVVYVANGTVTGRQPGQSFDHLIKLVVLSAKLKDDFVSNYYFTANNGKLIRSSTLLIRDGSSKLAGALCINLDTSRVAKQIDYLRSFLPEPFIPLEDVPDNVSEEAVNHVSQMVTSLIDNILSGCSSKDMSREEKIEKVCFMDAKGIFLMKGSIELVAEKLGVNKVTVYSYLDEARGKR